VFVVRSSDQHQLVRALLAGLAAGAIATLVASFLSLPLESPDDVYFNTATIAAGALLVGLGAGMLWWFLQRRRRPVWAFAIWMLVAALVTMAVTLVVDASPMVPLDGIARFVVPLAGVVFLAVTLFTPAFSRLPAGARLLGPAVAVVVVAAVGVGVGLAGQGDAESGRLMLPDLPSSGPTSTAGSSAGIQDGYDIDAGQNGSSPPPTSAEAGGLPAPAASADGEVIRAGDVAGDDFTVDPAQSTATYTVRQKLASLPLPNDVIGRTNAISGTLHLDGRPSTITVDLRSLDSGEAQRDMFLRERLGLPFNRFPLAEFTVSSLPELPSDYRAGEILNSSVTGTMKLRDVERPLTFGVEARLQGGVLQVLGRADFNMSDFQIVPPDVAGFVKAEDGVHVEVLIVAEADTTG
jgi:polyisoprenoid-binding protein YceI